MSKQLVIGVRCRFKCPLCGAGLWATTDLRSGTFYICEGCHRVGSQGADGKPEFVVQEAMP